MIFKRVRRKWLARAIVVMRWTRAVAYLMIALAGLTSLIWPPASVREASSGQTVALTWAALMMVSALFCAFGAALDRWVGEYIGLVPLALVAAIFGVSALSRGPVSISGGLFLLGFFGVLGARWQEVALIRVEAERRARERRLAGAYDAVRRYPTSELPLGPLLGEPPPSAPRATTPPAAAPGGASPDREGA